MKIYIGADHRGIAFKEKIKDILMAKKVQVVDMGTYDKSGCDYPKIAFKVATQVARSRADRGMLVCMSGIGQTIAANKVRGAYAALCYNAQSAALSRQHNNSNILVFGSKFTKSGEVKKIVDVWLKTEFEGGRHRRRFNQIKKIENGSKKL